MKISWMILYTLMRAIEIIFDDANKILQHPPTHPLIHNLFTVDSLNISNTYANSLVDEAYR